MQNIPGIDSDSVSEQYKTLRVAVTTKDVGQTSSFDELLQMHSAKVENELALSPVATADKMVESAPATTTTADQATSAPDSVAQSGEHRSSVQKRDQTDTTSQTQAETAAEDDADSLSEQKMTGEDFDKVKDSLKEYGFSDKEIKELEDKVDSDEGMTWNQFVSAIAEKMADMRKVSLTEDQKSKLTSFFSKLGFTDTQSARLLSRIEAGETGQVMSEIKAKLEALSDSKQLMLTSDEVTAFASAMQFSEELTGQLKEMLGQTSTTKDLRQAFALMDREAEAMDAKDRALVKAVGKAFAEATGKEVRESSAAADIGEAVDLKQRAADDNGAETMVKEDLKDALSERRDSMPESNAKKAAGTKTLPQQAEAQPEAQDQKTEDDSDRTWRDFFSKLRDDTSASTRQTRVKTESAEQALSSALADATGKSATEQSATKTTAPKVLRQVEQAFIRTLNNGAKQLTLQLSPENLGKLTVALQVNGKEVSAQIRAESAEAAKLIHDNLDVIKQALQDQGLKVDKLDVQTGLAGDQSDNSWFGQEQHNLARDREAMAAMRNHLRTMRGESVAAAEEAAQIPVSLQTDGLHLVA